MQAGDRGVCFSFPVPSQKCCSGGSPACSAGSPRDPGPPVRVAADIPALAELHVIQEERRDFVLGRRMMAETARRFLDRGIHSFILCAELSTPTLGFYDRMGEERLVDEQGQIDGAYGWRDLKALIALEPINRETP